jgi:hypothetical protein
MTRDALSGIKVRLHGTPRLLVIDEIHKLCGQAGDKALTVLRDLYDDPAHTLKAVAVPIPLLSV